MNPAAEARRRLSPRAWSLGAALVLAVACSDSSVEDSRLSAGAAAGSNVVLITLDTTRADRLGCYGHQAAQTPTLDRLAQRGVLFERALTVAPITLPSHATLMTGQIPPVHGVRDNGIHELSQSAITLAELLQQAGYSTAAFVSAIVLQGSFGLQQGFETYEDLMDSSRRGVLEPVERPAGRTIAAAQAWLNEQHPEPWFLWLHFFDPHFPYDAPEAFASSLPDPYDAELAYMDSAIAQFFSAYDQDERLDRTLVVVTADHGEGLGDHREATHGLFLYDSTMRVPLIFQGVGVDDGMRVNGQVSIADVFPTMLDLLGVKTSSTIQGASLLPALVGATTEVWHDCYLETYLPLLSYGLAPITGMSQGSFKYLKAPREELYDWSTDPTEASNLFEHDSETAAHAAAKLEELGELGGQAVTGTLLDPQMEEQLSQLGYLHGGSDDHAGADPKDAIAWVEAQAFALHLIQTGEYSKALPVLERVLRQAPRNATALACVGQAHFGLKEWSLAAEHFRKALDLRADMGYVEFYLGECYARLGDRQEALAAFDRLIEQFPTMGKAYLAASQVCFEGKDFGAAQSYLERGLQAIPADDYSRKTIASNLGHLRTRQN